LKNVQNETTISSFQSATLSVDGSIATEQASDFSQWMNWAYKRLKNGNNNDISDGVSVLLVVCWRKEKPNNQKRTL